MDWIPAFDQVTNNEHPILGSGPFIFYASGTPSGAADPWARAPLGSMYINMATGIAYLKKANAGANADWKAITTAA